MFGLGFGMVGQVLTVAVQNGVDRRRLGVAMATTTFFRGLGGAVGAAVLGAVFAARAGISGPAGAGGVEAFGTGARAGVIDAVQTVFAVAAPIAALALAVVILLKEVPLQGSTGTSPAERRQPAAGDETEPAKATVAVTPSTPNAATPNAPTRTRISRWIVATRIRGVDASISGKPGAKMVAWMSSCSSYPTARTRLRQRGWCAECWTTSI